MNGMCVKNNTIHICGTNKQWKNHRGVEALSILTCERLNIMSSVPREWSWHVNSIVACCHSAKLCAYATRDFRSQQNGSVTRMYRSCGVQPSHKERAIGAVRCKKEGMLLQLLRWCCVDCVIHHERDVHEEQHHTYMWREQAIKEWLWRGSSADINVWTIGHYD